MRVVAILVVILVLAAVPSARAAGPDRGAPEVLRASIAAGSAPLVVDVRTRGEYEAGHVPGAVHVPLHQLMVSTSGVPGPRIGA